MARAPAFQAGYTGPIPVSRSMLKKSNYVKIVVAVTKEEADKVRQALGQAGAGQQGKYKFCSGSYPATGRFIPQTGSNPAIGKTGKLEKVAEEIITTICHKDLVEKVILAIIEAHPYEEPVVYLLPMIEEEDL